MCDQNYSLMIGFEALGLEPGGDVFDALGLSRERDDNDTAISVIQGMMERAIRDCPETTSEILMAGIHLMAGFAESLDQLQACIIPQLGLMIDLLAVA